MGKENYPFFSDRNIFRFSPYNTPVYFRATGEPRRSFLSRKSTNPELDSSVDIQGLALYQQILQMQDEKARNSSSSPLTTLLQKTNKSRPSPGYPIRELRFQRLHEQNLSSLFGRTFYKPTCGIYKQLETLKDRILSLPVASSFSCTTISTPPKTLSDTNKSIVDKMKITTTISMTPTTSSDINKPTKTNSSAIGAEATFASATDFQKAYAECELKNRERQKRDDEKTFQNKIRDLEREVHDRSKARHNRQINDEIYRRLGLEMEGLVLEWKPRETKFPDLPPDADELIARAWNGCGSLSEVFSSGFSVDITRRDLLSLARLEWLNDEIINFYLSLVVERSRQSINLPKVYAFNTFFYQSLSTKGYDAIKRWTRKVDIFSFDILIIPLHFSVHWCVAIVDFSKKCILFYDSMLGNNEQCLNLLRNYLEKEHENKKKVPYNTDDWRLLTPKDIPRQLNGSDCGMFACKFAEYASRNAPIDFNQKHMPYFRRRMVYEICTQKLL